MRDRKVERERAALAYRAVRGDRAAEQLRDLPADRQAEAGAAVLSAGGPVRLLERAEDGLQLLLRDADPGVAHPERQRRPVAPGGRRQLLRRGRFDAQLDAAC